MSRQLFKKMQGLLLSSHSKPQRGFTLIELMIVVAILAILAMLTYPSYLSYVQRTHQLIMQENLMLFATQFERMKQNAKVSGQSMADEELNEFVTHIKGDYPKESQQKRYQVSIQSLTQQVNLGGTGLSASRRIYYFIAEPKSIQKEVGVIALSSHGAQCHLPDQETMPTLSKDNLQQCKPWGEK